MKNALVVIDDTLHHHKTFLSYVTREIEQKAGEIDTYYLIKKSDGDIISVLESVISEHKNVFLVTSEDFSFVSKVIATICHDGLVLKEGMLIPMKAEHYTKKSFLIHKGKSDINVLHVDPVQSMPKFWVSNQDIIFSCYLLGVKEQKKLESFFTQTEMRYEKIQLIDGFFFYKAYGIHQSQKKTLENMIELYLSDSVLIGDDVSKIICEQLIAEQKTITCAESCTGGMLASEIVKNSGVSTIFAGSVVTYANEIKENLIGVKKSTLKRYGAVSNACVKEMLEGVMEKFDADFSLAVSGIAGPTGGSVQKPVGTVYVGAKSRGFDMKIQKLSLKGDRTYIRQQSVLWALKLLLQSNRKFFFKKVSKTLDK